MSYYYPGPAPDHLELQRPTPTETIVFFWTGMKTPGLRPEEYSRSLVPAGGFQEYKRLKLSSVS